MAEVPYAVSVFFALDPLCHKFASSMAFKELFVMPSQMLSPLLAMGLLSNPIQQRP